MIQKITFEESEKSILEKFIDYLRHEKNGGLAEVTIDRYLLNLRHFQDQTGLDIQGLLRFTKYSQVAEVIRGLRARLKWTGTTPKNAADTASVFYNWAFREGIIKDTPMRLGHEFKNKPTPQMDFFDWESDDFKKLLYNPNNSVRDNAIFHSLRSSGLRSSELCALKYKNPNDVFIDKRCFRVRHGKGDVWHEANFDDETCKWLREHITSLPYHSTLDYLFQNEDYTMPLTSNTLYKMLKRKAEKVGLHAYARKFRRSLGGEMISNGADLTMVKDQLGHKSIQTTARFYVHFSTKRKKENYEKFVPKFRSGYKELLSA